MKITSSLCVILVVSLAICLPALNSCNRGRAVLPGLTVDGYLGDADAAGTGIGQDALWPGPGQPGSDTAPACHQPPFEVGCPCQANSDCAQGYCVEGPDGFVCSKHCVEDCPPGWECKGIDVLGDPTFVCIPVADDLCQPCEAGDECQSGMCLQIWDGRVCTRSCDVEEPCPPSYECITVSGAGTLSVCQPESWTCSCMPANHGEVRSCSTTNDWGTCQGFQECDSTAGWSKCTSAEPLPEDCDGWDNNCNGYVDEGLAGTINCKNVVAGIGICPGSAFCAGELGWVCDAPEPKIETCDSMDNDCDGDTDEDFKDSDGKFSLLHHCGGCNHDCEDSLPNAVAQCVVGGDDSECQVKECLPGYYQLNESQCIEPPEVGCKPCSVDEDCYLGKCADIDGIKACLDSCAETPCPSGFICTSIGWFDQLCVPQTGSCQCNEANAGKMRSCSMSNEAGTCFGYETCVPESGWSDCTAGQAEPEICDSFDNDCNWLIDDGLDDGAPCWVANQWGACEGALICSGAQGWLCQGPEAGPETCDGEDNDCDGEIDEEFKVEGKYVLDDHCGGCGNDCAGAIEHGTGKCDPTYPVPVCVVESCEDGFYPLNPFQCLVPPDTTCQECIIDDDCKGHTCMLIDGQSRCAGKCETNLECAVEMQCVEVAGMGSMCQPLSGSCDCNQASTGIQKSCKVTNEFGSCLGLSKCHPPAGWSDCEAPVPGPEECNGLDDNCNGYIDDALGEPPVCIKSNQWGECPGTSTCANGFGWVCQVPDPAPEICDYLDNDCDGLVDDGFLMNNGLYVHDKHCGSCSQTCQGWVQNGTAECAVVQGQAVCVLKECNAGFVMLDGSVCVPAVPSICSSCKSAADCPFNGGTCVSMATGGFCSMPCAVVSDCPQGFGCLKLGFQKLCLPATGSCDCNGTNLGLTAMCTRTHPEQPIPGQQPTVCYGIQECTPDGWTDCIMPPEKCDSEDNDCNGIVDDGFKVDGEYTLDEHCRQCGNDCTFLSVANGTGVCDAELDPPDCTMECLAGFVDVNENPTDGCECEVVSANDAPDVDCVDFPLCSQQAKDQNCDGVDGNVSNAVFVAKHGHHDNPGTIAKPLATIEEGIEQAAGLDQTDVYVATGLYTESVILAPEIRVYGGYSSDFRQRNIIQYETVIMGSGAVAGKPGVVNAIQLVGEPASTVLDGFTIIGANASQTGASSYAVYVRDCDDALQVSGNTILAGDGGAGGQGSNGQDGANGMGGTNGNDSLSHGSSSCDGSGPISSGGLAGTHQCGEEVISGGAGGASHCPSHEPPPQAGEFGEDGSGPAPGAGGYAGWDGDISYDCDHCHVHIDFDKPMEGGNGGKGAAGLPGDAGPGGAGPFGQLDGNGNWQSAAGGAGATGTNGSGGGGGGAGAGTDVTFAGWGWGWDSCTDHIGGTGGGGGSGGCRGTGGGGGGGGGGSFGLFMIFTALPKSLPVVFDNLAHGGLGGKGGPGGVAGTGGLSGDGGEGGSQGYDQAWCAEGGGNGGNGGSGGHGGGGGGGAGGASVALFVSGQGAADLTMYLTGNQLMPGIGGAGGSGGPSVGNSGNTGIDGATALSNF